MLDNGYAICNWDGLVWGNAVILSIVVDKSDWKIKLL